MSGQWRALALPSVKSESIREALTSVGVDWSSAAHVAATGSLTGSLLDNGMPAMSIVNLIDVVVWAGMPEGYRKSIDHYPPASLIRDGERAAFESRLQEWAADLLGRRIRLGLLADLRLRRYLDGAAADREVARVLRRSLKQFRRSTQALIAADFHPGDFEASDPLLRVAQDAWQVLERDVPEITGLRDDLWIDPAEFARGTSVRATDLRARVDHALDHCFGPCTGRRTIVYHGFYFYSPQQWAFFQLLRAHPDVDQYFIVHDDGTNRSFEIWRRFFLERWEMPRPEHLASGSTPSDAEALRSALEGRPIDGDNYASRVRLLRCSTPASFAREWLREMIHDVGERPGPRLYAAGADDLDRMIRRFAQGTAESSVELADLPVGQFLLALHECVSPNRSGGYRLTLTAPRLIDLVASGLLDSADGSPKASEHLGAFRRSMPYFEDADDLDQWVDRADRLVHVVTTHVAPHGQRGGTMSDVQRMSRAASNPLRLVPWADLSATEARLVASTIGHIAGLIHEVVSVESQSPERYLGWIRMQLQRGMENLGPDDRRRVEATLRSGLVDGDQLDVEGVIEVVTMLLGRETEVGLDGEPGDRPRRARPLRDLDTLGFVDAPGDIHLANLADTMFPISVQPIQWPFVRTKIRDEKGPVVSIELLRTREETASLGDLYLLWLALDGRSEGTRLTMSWIEEMGSDRLNPSPLIAILAIPDHRSDAVRDMAGGLPYGSSEESWSLVPDRRRPEPRPWIHDAEAIAQAVATFDPLNSSSALVCPRRFPLQWLLGSSAAFQSAHHHAMLYGNMQGALVRKTRLGEDNAISMTDDLWAQLSGGQRLSSRLKRRVQPTGPTARWQWIHTLSGQKEGADPHSLAYTAAYSGTRPPVDAVAPSGSGVLPLPSPMSRHRAICDNCPVGPRCSMRATE